MPEELAFKVYATPITNKPLGRAIIDIEEEMKKYNFLPAHEAKLHQIKINAPKMTFTENKYNSPLKKPIYPLSGKSQDFETLITVSPADFT